jgi:hypothetical protein
VENLLKRRGRTVHGLSRVIFFSPAAAETRPFALIRGSFALRFACGAAAQH